MVRIGSNSNTERVNEPEPTDQKILGAATPEEVRAEEMSWDELALEPATIDGHHLRHVYRMSGLGGDLSQLVAGALQIEQGPMPGWLQPYLDEGKVAEPVILAMFHEGQKKRRATYGELVKLKEAGTIAGYNPEEEQVQVRLLVGSSAMVRGHTDEICVVNPKGKKTEFAVVEAKKLRPTLYNMWKVTRTFGGDPTLTKYGWQVAALFWSTGLPVYFVVGEFDPEKGEVVSIDVLLITETNVPYTLAQIKARVMKAESYAKKGEVPQCEMKDDACVYGAENFCLGKPEVEFTDLDDVDLGKLLGLHYAYGIDMQPDDEQKEAKKERDKIKQQIDKYMADKGYARGEKFHVWDEAGNEFEYEWVQTEVDARAYTTSYPKIKVIGELAHEAPEDDG